jgi:hypothetical protein
MKQQSTPKGTNSRKYGFFLAFGLVLLIVATLLVRHWEHGTGSKESAGKVNLPISVDSSTLAIIEPPHPGSVPAPVVNAPEPARAKKKLPKPERGKRVMPPPRPMTLTGKVDSWEDWNSSFSDTVTRTYSAIFDSARLDTASGARLVFAASGRSEDFVRVKKVFCIVDSVRPLVKYTFPGESVDFGIGVGFAAGVSFKGELQPRGRMFTLEHVATGDERFTDEGSIARNQFVVVLNSPPGYTYSLRTGIECFMGEERSEETRTYITSPAKVEFRRMIRFQSLLAESGDTLFIVTANPGAISDLLKDAPRSWVSAVFVPVHDRSESEDLLKEENPRLRIQVSVPRPLDKSFVILNDSVALVEKNVLDPEFKRTAQLKLKGLQLNRIGLPRVTNLVRGESAVEELKLLFIHFDRLTPQ